MEQAAGDRVHEALRATLAVTGTPRQILSDGGTELKKGVELLHLTHPAVDHVQDIKHQAALLLKKELEHNPRWAAFVTQANKTKLSLVQTALAFLVPPSLKVKARYMNLDTLVAWGRHVLRYLNEPRALPETPPCWNSWTTNPPPRGRSASGWSAAVRCWNRRSANTNTCKAPTATGA